MYIYNAKIHTMSGQTLENGYIRIENGKIAELSRAKLTFVESDELNAVSDADKARLREMTPATYTGNAAEQARTIKEWIAKI